MLAKNLSFLSNADAAGIVLGARVPIVAPTRNDSMEVRMASCVLASLLFAGGLDAGASAPSLARDTGTRAAA